MEKKQRATFTLASKRAVAGLLFTSPFIIGFLLLYLTPLIRSIVFSLSKITGGMKIEYTGFSNFRYALFGDPDFTQKVVSSLLDLLTIAPSILFFSFFISVVLNQKFRGRIFARIIFFLPVIITSGIIALMQNDIFLGAANATLNSANDNTSNTINLVNFIMNTLPFDTNSFFINIITTSVNKIYQITTASGVQILIFLAGLQSISPSLYEASSIEGASAWENFWKVTLPMISPLILVTAVYTIIDYCNGLTNIVSSAIYNTTFTIGNIGLASAMSWIYSAIVLILLGIIIFMMNKMVYYEND